MTPIDAPGSSAGMRPCDGIDKGTHYCCIKPGDGVASNACCSNSSNIFVLGNSIPTVVAQMPLSQTTSATATPTGTTTATSTGGSESDDSSSSTTTIGLGVGLGVGIPLAVAVAGSIWFFTRRSRRNQGQQTAGANGLANGEEHGPGGSGYPNQMAPAPGYSPVPQGQQLSHPGSSPKHAMHEGMAPQEMPAQSPLPTEMTSTPSKRPRSELPS